VIRPGPADPLRGLESAVHALFLGGPIFFHLVGLHQVAIVGWVAAVASGIGLRAWDRSLPVLSAAAMMFAFDAASIGYTWFLGIESGANYCLFAPLVLSAVLLDRRHTRWKVGLIVLQLMIILPALTLAGPAALPTPPPDAVINIVRVSTAFSAAGVLLFPVLATQQVARMRLLEATTAHQSLVDLLDHHRTTEDKLREAVREADRARADRSTFFQNVSHELRTPLATVLGLGEALQEEAEQDRPEDVDDLRHLMRAGRQLHQAIEDLLDMAVADRMVQATARQPFPTADLFASLEAAFAGDSQYGTLEIGERPGTVVLDRVRVQRALMEVLEFAHRTGCREMHLSAERHGGSVIFTVQGPCPTPDASADEPGVGLYFAHRMTEQMGGDLVMEHAPNGDSRVRLILPEGKKDPIRVLVVDDMRVNGEVLVARVAEQGGHATWVDSGQAALDLLRSGRRVDVILLDLQMPGMNGIETARAIHALDLNPRPRIVAVTADDSDATWQGCMAEGFEARLLKPVQIDVLGSVLTRPASAPEAWSAAGRLDPGVLRDIAAELDDPGFIDEMVQWFGQAATDRIAEGRDAARRGDAETARRSAHSLKGAAASVGATRLHMLARDLEQLGQAGDVAGSEPRWALVEEEVSVVTRLLADLS